MYSRKTKEYAEGILLTRVQTDRLIELYKADQGLWDLSSSVYHNKDKRRKALQNILDILREEYDGFDGTVDQLQYKLSNLRGYYSRELSKIRKSQRMPSDDIYVSSWRLFEPLDSFLRAQITPRKHPSNQEATCKIEPEDYDSDEEMFLVSDDSEEPSNLSFHSKNVQMLQGSHHHPPSSESESMKSENRIDNFNRIKRPKISSPSETVWSQPEHVPLENESRKTKKPRFPVALETMTTETNVCTLPSGTDRIQDESKMNISEDEDDDSLFARYMTMELRKIKDARTKAFVKFKIHSIIFESQFGAPSQHMSSVNPFS